MVGLAYFSLVVLFLLLMWGFYWYIRTQRQHEIAQSKHHAEQYERRLVAEREMTDALHTLVLAIKGRPCMRGDTDRIQGQTRRYERKD